MCWGSGRGRVSARLATAGLAAAVAPPQLAATQPTVAVAGQSEVPHSSARGDMIYGRRAMEKTEDRRQTQHVL